MEGLYLHCSDPPIRKRSKWFENNRNVFVIWVLLGALLVQIFPVWAFAATPLSSSDDASFSPTQIEICTANGILVVDLDGNPIPLRSTDTYKRISCVFCMPLMHAGPPITSTVDVVIWASSGYVDVSRAIFRSLEDTGNDPLAGAASPQAPPAA